MAKAIVTPTDLRDFATILQKNIEEFTLIENSMNQKLSNYDWKDAVALKFKADFEATKEPLNKLRQQMEEFMSYLVKKADTLLGTDSGGINLKPIMMGAAGVGAGAAGQKKGKSTKGKTNLEISKDGKSATITGKAELEHQFNKKAKAYMRGEGSKTERKPAKGAMEAGIGLESDKGSKFDITGRVNKTERRPTERVIKGTVSIPLGSQPKKNSVNLNQLTEQDIQRLAMKGIYPSVAERIFKNSRDKYKDILDSF